MKIDFTQSPIVMGILNVTPDSFSDGGKFVDVGTAVVHALQMHQHGAQIIDVGGESTRPNATPVDVSVEIDRVIPVIKALAGRGMMISVDTRNADTMHAALNAGAHMVNDVSALTHDPKSIDVIRELRPYVCVMHMKGDPKTMQENPQYDDVVGEVFNFLTSRVIAVQAAGIDPKMILADVGIGFGKTLEQNLKLLKNINKFHDLGVALMIGSSRKSFIKKISGVKVEDRLGGSIASALWAYQKGVQVFRAHDVAETVQALAVWGRVNSAT